MIDHSLYPFVFTAMMLGHLAGDIIAQPHQLSLAKSRHGRAGMVPTAVHVLAYLAAQAWILAAALALAELDIALGRLAAGLAFSAATHFAIDRPEVLARIARATGSAEFVEDRFGRLVYDQTCHILAIGLAAGLITT